MDRWFEDFFGDEATGMTPRGDRSSLPLNVWEDDEGYHVQSEVPGLDEHSLELEVRGNHLTLAGTYESDEAEGVKYHRRERTRGTFRRQIKLPGEIDAANVAARLEDGVLTVTLPKAEAAKPRRLTITKKS